MRLTEVKRMKVAQLRSKLRALDLDCSGLKPELVDRLWTALQSGRSGTGCEENREQHDNIQTPLSNTETVLTQVSPPSPTETDASAPEPVRAGGAKTESDPALTTTTTTTTTLRQQQGSEVISQHVSEVKREEGEADRAQSSEQTGRGRAFYEFKEEIRYKRAKTPEPVTCKEEPKKEEEDDVRLDQRNCHLHFEVGPDGSSGQPRFWDRFPALWSGCRLTHGVLQGRVGFEVRLERKLLPIKQENDAHTELYGLRVGWSMISSSLLLGEDEASFAYDGRSKKVSGGKEEDFGEQFSVGDIIGCCASFSTDGAVELSFYKNGRFMGVAFSLGASVLRRAALFPHVLCKSCSVSLHLDPTALPWYPSRKGFTPLAALSAEQRVYATSAPNVRGLCEVLLMVGLPGSGKSHWARTHMKQHPAKQYKLLSTEELLACMISGGQKDRRLQQASQCLTEVIKLAAQAPANYILDQCNVLFSARCHKIKLFAGFRQRAVVVFPSAKEWRRRLSLLQESENEQIPETSLLKLQVSCSLPEQQGELEEVLYVALPQEQTQALLQEYKEEAARLLPPIIKHEKKKPRLHTERPCPPGTPFAHRNQWIGRYGWMNMDLVMWREPTYWNGFDDWSLNRDFVDRGYEGF